MTATVPAAEFDALLLDLDGTVYLGGQVIEHVGEALAAARELGSRPMYVTNNASRPPAEVAAALTAMGVPATDEEVLTSPEAAATMLADTHPAGSAVLVIGAPWLATAVQDAGLVPVRTAAEGPVALVQGHSPDTGWVNLAEGCIALRSGIDWVACNVDSTLPTDRGLLPGNGSMVAALVAATGLTPRVAGKPASPLLDEAVRRAGSSNPLVVGDRLDTDIEAGCTAGYPALLVLTGVSTAQDLVSAPEHQRPTHVSLDMRGLIDAGRVVDLRSADTSAWTAVTADGAVTLARSGGAPAAHDQDDRSRDAEALHALAAVVVAAWAGGSTRVVAADDDTAAVLARAGLTADR
ncbi:HAD hydrolase-like protein [Nakamurella flavida]|uniref:HAD hydrolase-like protein n=1 Tax=Nakamurella flavida TaxID=363630 RepID=A0A938YIC7_9ACTN|nr:HAD hydrolase-like protein [Nakamurella flavida]MBM9478236.1 HAD hydrolase-like protein [Nakamurella flavida]MDP9777594.1 HAD superfamily hydrolase (TIGR01450 family) [Nakamurella flavida]